MNSYFNKKVIGYMRKSKGLSIWTMVSIERRLFKTTRTDTPGQEFPTCNKKR